MLHTGTFLHAIIPNVEQVLHLLCVTVLKSPFTITTHVFGVNLVLFLKVLSGLINYFIWDV